MATPEIKRKFIVVEPITHRPQQFLPFSSSISSFQSFSMCDSPITNGGNGNGIGNANANQLSPSNFSTGGGSKSFTHFSTPNTTRTHSSSNCDSPLPVLFESEEELNLHSTNTPMSNNSNCSSPASFRTSARGENGNGSHGGNNGHNCNNNNCNINNNNSDNSARSNNGNTSGRRANTPMDFAFENKLTFLVLGTDGVFDVMFVNFLFFFFFFFDSF